MKENIKSKVDLMAENAKVINKSAKLDFVQAANLGALIFTGENTVAAEADIRANRAILKNRVGMLNNMRGPAANLSVLAHMTLSPDPEEYLDKVLAAYESIKSARVFKSESLVFAATAMADDTDPAEFDQSAKEAWATLEKMRAAHPLLTNQDDLALAHMLASAGLDVDELLDEAEAVYERLKPTGFKLKKDTLQSISIILALSEKPLEEKCARFEEIRQALIDAGERIYGMELAVVAAFVDIDKPAAEMVQDVAEVEAALKHVRGFGPLLCGANLRRLYSSALVLQAYGEENRRAGAVADGSVAQNIASVIVFEVIALIIMMIVITSINASINAAT